MLLSLLFVLIFPTIWYSFNLYILEFLNSGKLSSFLSFLFLLKWLYQITFNSSTSFSLFERLILWFIIKIADVVPILLFIGLHKFLNITLFYLIFCCTHQVFYYFCFRRNYYMIQFLRCNLRNIFDTKEALKFIFWFLKNFFYKMC